MADQIALSSTKVPIGAWMLQGDPAQPEMLAALAYATPDEPWTWDLRPSDRTSQMAPGHPVLFWMGESGHPDVTSGIWLAGEVVEGPVEGEPWEDDHGRTVVPLSVTVRLEPLVTPISKAALVNHRVLHDLQILIVPAMPSPHVVSVAQLDALRADFDLTTGPLSDELRASLLSVPPILMVRGPGETPVEVYEEDEGFSVWVAGEQVATHPEWRAAFADAVDRRDPDLSVSESGDPETLAVVTAGDGAIWIVQLDGEFQAYLHLDADDSLEQMDGTFPSLADAVVHHAADLWDAQ